MDLGLQGKTVIVTGGGSNIGREIVLSFARVGANVVIAEIDAKQGQVVAGEAISAGGTAMVVQTDATRWDSVQAMVETTRDRFGSIDVLVNCVGGGATTRPLAEVPIEECEQQIDLTFRSVLYCTRAVIGHMMERKYGKIISLSSPAGQTGLAGRMASVYGAMKGAIISFSKAVAWEVGPYGINVNVVVPGWTLPESSDQVAEQSTWKKGVPAFTPELLKRAMKYQPIQRMGMPEDTANVVVFLASDLSSYVTAQTISVTGGATSW